MTFTSPDTLTPAGPCRAENKENCRYHGAFERLEQAKQEGDYETYSAARAIINQAQAEEFNWLTKAAQELNSRPVGEQFYTKEDIRVRLISDLMAENQHIADDNSPEAKGAKEAIQVIAQNLTHGHVAPSRSFAGIRLRKPLSPEEYRRLEQELLDEAAEPAEQNYVPSANIMKGRFNLYGDEWVDGEMVIRPVLDQQLYPGEEPRPEQIVVEINFKEQGPDGKMGTRSSSGFIDSPEDYIRVYKTDEATTHFLRNVYDRNSPEVGRRVGFRRITGMLRKNNWNVTGPNGTGIRPFGKPLTEQ